MFGWCEQFWRKTFDEDQSTPSFILMVLALGLGGLAVVLATIAIFSVLDAVESLVGLH